MCPFPFHFSIIFVEIVKYPIFEAKNHGKDNLIPCKSLQVNELVLWSTKISILN